MEKYGTATAKIDGSERVVLVRVRHEVSPEPSGCRWFGALERAHGMVYSRAAKAPSLVSTDERPAPRADAIPPRRLS